jgi:mono/diheme cytochrome c family protein
MRIVVVATAVATCGLFVLNGEAPSPTVFTAAQAAAGRVSYESSCAKCHTATLVGRDGTGDVPEFLQPYNGMIPPLAGANAAYPPFLTKWGAPTTKDLSTRINEAISGFPPKDLDAQTYLNLTAYVLQINGARAGDQPLTKTTAVEIRSVTTPAK